MRFCCIVGGFSIPSNTFCLIFVIVVELASSIGKWFFSKHYIKVMRKHQPNSTEYASPTVPFHDGHPQLSASLTMRTHLWGMFWTSLSEIGRPYPRYRQHLLMVAKFKGIPRKSLAFSLTSSLSHQLVALLLPPPLLLHSFAIMEPSSSSFQWRLKTNGSPRSL